MALRILLAVLMILASRGMFLHYIGDDCGHDKNCPICQQVTGTPVEDTAPAAGPAIDFGSYQYVVILTGRPHFNNYILSAVPRAPPVLPA